MKKLMKVLLAVTGLCLTAVIAAVIYLSTLDPNDYRGYIADEFYERTGRILSLGGDLELTFYPWLGVGINDVSVSNPGFGNEPLLYADNASVRVKLLPMLTGQYEIDTIRLYGADINLMVNEDGVSNWEDLIAAAEEDDDAAATEDAGLSLANLVLGGVDIRDGSLSLDDRARGVRYAIDEFSMRSGALTYGDPIELDLSFNGSASDPELEAQVTLQGTLSYADGGSRYSLSPLRLDALLRGPNVPDGEAMVSLNAALAADLEADTLSISELSLAALGTRLDASVQGRRIQSDTPAYEAEVALAGEDPGVLFRLLEQDALAQRLASLPSQSFALDASLSLDLENGSLNVPMLRGDLLGAGIDANLAAAGIRSGAPTIRGALQAAGPDLPTLIEVAGYLQGGADSPLSQYGRELARVPDKEFSVNADFDADLGAGNINVPTLTIDLLGASVRGELAAADLQSDSPVVRGQLNASGPDLPLLMQIAGQLQGGVESPLNVYGRQLRGGMEERGFDMEASFDANLVEGNIQMPVLSASMLGFELEGKLATRQDGTIDGTLRLSGDDLPPFLRAAEQPDLADVFDSMALNISLSGTRNDLVISPLHLVLVFSGPQIPNSPVNVVLNADSMVNLEQQTLALDSFTISGLGLDVSGAVTANNILDAPDFNGNIDVAAFNLRQLLQRLNQEAPPTASPDTLELVALRGAFNGSPSHFKLDQLTFRLDDTTLQGNFSLSDFDDPAMEFALNIDQLDADRYLSTEAAPQESGEEAPSTELPVEELRRLKLNGELNIGQLTLSGMDFSDFAVTVEAAEGLLSIAPSTRLYGGSYGGLITLNTATDAPALDLQSTLTGIAVGPFMRDLMGTTHVSGNGNIELNLDAVGTDTAALIRSLDGTGRVELVDGVLRGVDVAAVLGQVETMIRSRRLGEIRRGEETAFNNFSATLLVDDGVVTSNNLRIGAPGFLVTGTGTLINLNDETLSFDLVTEVDRTTATRDSEEYNLSGYSLPIRCTGTIASPRCLPDTQRIVQEALSGAVQREVGNFIQRALGGDRSQSGDEATQRQQGGQQQGGQQESGDAAEDLLNQAIENLLR